MTERDYNKNDIAIEDLLLNITNFCLGSCVYCDLKSLKGYEHDQEIMIYDIENLLTDPYLDNLKNCHLTGGEPILSPKLWETCLLVKKYHPDIRLNMPVSGFFPYATYRYIKKIHDILPQLRIDVSVDGTTKKIHEITRGKDSWEPLNKTIDLLKSIDGLKVQLQLTLMESNVEEISKVQKWAEDLGFGFYLTFPHFGSRFGHEKDESHKHLENFIEKVDAQIKDNWCKIRPLNEQIWTCQKAIWRGKTVYHDCLMGKRSIDIAPNGDCHVCMCYYKELLLGNIKHQPLIEILENGNAKKVFDKINSKMCQPCIMPCCPFKKNFVIDGVKMDF